MLFLRSIRACTLAHRCIVDQPSDQTFDIEKLRTQQDALNRQGRLHWVHWFIATATLLITILAWKTSSTALAEQQRAQFNQESERVISLMRERIEHYADALLSGVATMQAHDGQMSRSDWNRYANYLNLTERYPGANGIGVIHYVDTQDVASFVADIRHESPGFTIHPEHIYELSLPITYIEPEQENAAALGLDVAFETNRRSAALYARTTGSNQISGPIVLVQDEGKTPGFLFYSPYFDHSQQTLSTWTDEEREARFQGLIYAPVVVKKLVEGVLSAHSRSVSLSISDGDTVMYAEANDKASARYSMTRDMNMHGRVWTFELVSMPTLFSAAGVNQPIIVLVTGLCLDAMLFALFWMMSRTNHRTLSMAREMTDTLAAQTQTLSDNNHDLENFAHVVSHDLKAPMRNIQTLVGIIDEDFGNYLASNDEGIEIKETLEMMSNQAHRGQHLIDGILEYSKAGAEPEQRETVDTAILVASIGAQLNLSPGQLTLSGSFPVLDTHATLLEQIFSNLIGNGIKFNTGGKPATVHVNVSLNEEKTHYCFSVRDNGPGIEPRFHERVFEQFASLNTDPNIQSSGIGLSIVRRALDKQGCSITLDSALGEGSTFEFTWPATHSDENIQELKRSA